MPPQGTLQLYFTMKYYSGVCRNNGQLGGEHGVHPEFTSRFVFLIWPENVSGSLMSNKKMLSGRGLSLISGLGTYGSIVS